MPEIEFGTNQIHVQQIACHVIVCIGFVARSIITSVGNMNVLCFCVIYSRLLNVIAVLLQSANNFYFYYLIFNI